MPSHSILPPARRAAIEAAFDEALAEVRAAGDVALLQECRAIFRQRVPFNLRAYVAAALVLKGPAAARQSDKRGRDAHPAKDVREVRDSREARPGSDKKSGGRPEKGALQSPAPKRAEKPKAEAPVREDREPREPREVRYHGEGVTLFVSAGRRQRFYARIAIKILLEIPGVSDESIGDIRTMDNYSFIVVDPAVEEAVVAALSGYDFKGRALAANRARKRGESAPPTEGAASADAEPVETVRDYSEASIAADHGVEPDGYDDADEPEDLDDSGLPAFGSGSDDDYSDDDVATGSDDEYSDDDVATSGDDATGGDVATSGDEPKDNA